LLPLCLPNLYSPLFLYLLHPPPASFLSKSSSPCFFLLLFPLPFHPFLYISRSLFFICPIMSLPLRLYHLYLWSSLSLCPFLCVHSPMSLFHRLFSSVLLSLFPSVPLMFFPSLSSLCL
jgi:hypothetical protein